MASHGGWHSAAIVRVFEDHFRRFMRNETELGRSPPEPMRARFLHNNYRHEVTLELECRDRQRLSVALHRSDLERLDITSTRNLPSEREILQLWWRVFEDMAAERELRAAHDHLLAIVQRATDRDVIRAAQESYRLREQEVRRHREGGYQEYYEGPISGPRGRRSHRTYQMEIRHEAMQVALMPLVDAAQQRAINDFMSERMDVFMRDAFYGVGGDFNANAQNRGLQLLKSWLSPLQLCTYEKERYFDVIGSDTAKTYRIRHGRSLNIDELGRGERKVCTWCFLPQGGLVEGDVMLAQKIALETDERAALAVANRFS
jgi:hypothetical protein